MQKVWSEQFEKERPSEYWNISHSDHIHRRHADRTTPACTLDRKGLSLPYECICGAALHRSEQGPSLADIDTVDACDAIDGVVKCLDQLSSVTGEELGNGRPLRCQPRANLGFVCGSDHSPI